VYIVLWDILIVVGIGFSQIVTAWYGIHVSVKENRVRNAIIIGIVGAVGIGLTVWGAIRSGTAQTELKSQLTTIQHNTETPPQVTVNVPPSSPVVIPPSAPPDRADVVLHEVSGGIKQSVNGIPTGVTAVYRLGETAAINIYFVNSGTADADMDGAAKIYLVPERSEKIEKVLTADFTKFVMHRTPTPSPLQHGGQSGYWFSGQSEKIITQEDIDKLKNGTTILYLYFEVEYKDPTGHHYQHDCRWEQPSASEAEIIWHYCSDYADHG
jgi:hypothetical protein